MTKNPHGNFYAAEDMLDKFTTAYLIEGALHFFGMESIEDDPTLNDPTLNVSDKQCPKEYVHTLIQKFLTEHVLNLPPCQPGENILKCRYCGKIYQKQKRLDDHEKQHRELLANNPNPEGFQCQVCGKVYKKEHFLSKHLATHPQNREPQADEQPVEEGDYVYNYTRRVLAICCLRLNFEDAIKKGDGERVMLCYKFMYLYCKEAGCPKYAYGLLETVCQAKYLLSPRNAHDLVWNRFINNRGDEDTNMPIDLDVEHCNKPLKTDVHTFRGEITDKSVQRISRSVEESDKVLHNYDRQTHVKMPSGKHKEVSFQKDVAKIVDHLHQKQVYRNISGRQHIHIGCISADPLASLDMKALHKWVKESVRGWSDKSYYNC